MKIKAKKVTHACTWQIGDIRLVCIYIGLSSKMGRKTNRIKCHQRLKKRKMNKSNLHFCVNLNEWPQISIQGSKLKPAAKDSCILVYFITWRGLKVDELIICLVTTLQIGKEHFSHQNNPWSRVSIFPINKRQKQGIQFQKLLDVTYADSITSSCQINI